MSNDVYQEGAGSKGSTLYGIIAIVLGVFAMMAPGLTGLSIATMVGFLVVVAGVVRMLWAFKAKSLGGGILVFVIGALTLLCGLALVAHPLFASGTLTILLAIYFLVDGIVEIAAAFKIKPVSGWGLMLFGGIMSVLLGCVMWAQFPVAGAWSIGILLGIKLFMVGMIMITAPAEA
jgi:uncharacterized membrane protein HdeD (DUF308 family)